MVNPLQVTFRDGADSPFLLRAIEVHAARLDRYFPRIVSCRVMLEKPHRHRHSGALYHVRIELCVPGREIVVQRDPSAHEAHRDAYVSIRDAFAAARRQLEAYAAERRQPGPLPSPAFAFGSAPPEAAADAWRWETE
jgi:ribosome-associated translation inhibitor RaiA